MIPEHLLGTRPRGPELLARFEAGSPKRARLGALIRAALQSRMVRHRVLSCSTFLEPGEGFQDACSEERIRRFPARRFTLVPVRVCSTGSFRHEFALGPPYLAPDPRAALVVCYYQRGVCVRCGCLASWKERNMEFRLWETFRFGDSCPKTPIWSQWRRSHDLLVSHRRYGTYIAGTDDLAAALVEHLSRTRGFEPQGWETYPLSEAPDWVLDHPGTGSYAVVGRLSALEHEMANDRRVLSPSAIRLELSRIGAPRTLAFG